MSSVRGLSETSGRSKKDVHVSERVFDLSLDFKVSSKSQRKIPKNSDGERNIRCNRVGLQSIPAFSNRTEFEAQAAFFASNGITTIQPDAFLNGYNQLKILKLHDNNITEISSQSFNTLQELEKLFLQDNFIESIEDYCFNDLLNLKFLFLDNNRIQFVSKAGFEKYFLLIF